MAVLSNGERYDTLPGAINLCHDGSWAMMGMRPVPIGIDPKERRKARRAYRRGRKASKVKW